MRSLQETVERLSRSDPSLTLVLLNHLEMGNHGCRKVAQAMNGNDTVVSLSLVANNLTNISSLAFVLRNMKRLRTINLSHNRIGDDGAILLANILAEESCCLQMVRLENCDIGIEGAQALADALRRNKTLQRLILNENSFGLAGIQAFADCLLENKTLKELHWKGMPCLGPAPTKAEAQADLLLGLNRLALRAQWGDPVEQEQLLKALSHLTTPSQVFMTLQANPDMFVQRG